MSFEELKEKIAALTPEERLELSHWISHLFRKQDAEYQAELDPRMRDMDEGKKYTLEEVERILEERSARVAP